MKHFRIGKTHHNYTHPLTPRYASTNAVVGKPIFKGTIKVITYNIKLSKNVHKAVELLAQNDCLGNADIICLQEMDPDGVDLIAKTLNYNYVYYPAIFHPRNFKEFGNAILSKWPILDDRKIILPNLGAGILQRVAVSAIVSVNHIQIMVFCVHMKVFVRLRDRRIPVDSVIRNLKPSIKHCIVAGDFNTFSRSSCRAILKPFQEAKFRLATDSVGWTYKYWYLLNKKSRLDHIFTKGMSVIRAGTVINRAPSDHIPVWGELAIR